MTWPPTETVKAAQDAHLEQLATKADIAPPRRRSEACQVDARHCHCRHRHPLAQKPAGVNTPMSEAAPRTSPRKVGAKMGRGFLIRRPDPLPPVAPAFGPAPPSALPHRFFLPSHTPLFPAAPSPARTPQPVEYLRTSSRDFLSGYRIGVHFDNYHSTPCNHCKCGGRHLHQPLFFIQSFQLVLGLLMFDTST